MMAPPLPPFTFTDEPEHIGQLRDTLRRFVSQHAPRESRIQWDRDHRWPRDVYAELNKLGLTALTVPEAYGGAGQDLVAAIAVIEELAQAAQGDELSEYHLQAGIAAYVPGGH